MNCGWCGANADGTDSHGICASCAERMALQSAQRQYDKTPSYVEVQATLFAQECEEILSQECIGAC